MFDDAIVSTRRLLTALSLCAALLIAAPVTAEVGQSADTTAPRDPFLGERVVFVGEGTPKNGGSDPAPVPATLPTSAEMAGTYVFGCVADPRTGGNVVYGASRFTVTSTGYTRDTLLFTDPACTVPLVASR